MAGTIDARLSELGIELPPAAAPVANYVPFVVTGNLVFVSGQIPLAEGRVQFTGRLGDTVTPEDGYAAARLCGLNLIAQVRAATDGDLDRVRRVVKLGGFVSCAPGFIQIPQVINGASDLMADVFAEAGRHARFAVAAPVLPMDAAVEVDGIFEIG